MTPRNDVSLIIPSLDDAENLRHLLPRLDPAHEIIIVEGGDLAATEQVVRRSGVPALVLSQEGRGKGHALLLGCHRASRPFLVTLDADGSSDPAEIPRLVAALAAGAVVARGSRRLPGGGSTDLTLLRAAGNRGLLFVANLLFGTRFSDLCYGFNGLRADALPQLGLTGPPGVTLRPWGRGFEIEALLACRVARSGVVSVEVPSREYPRLHGTSRLRTWRDGARVLVTLLHEWASPRVRSA